MNRRILLFHNGRLLGLVAGPFFLRRLMVAAALLACVSSGIAQKEEAVPVVEERAMQASLDSFAQMKFGLFIHWGLYAIPAGEWNGRPVRGIGEWIMRHEEIPVAEYAQLARQFNPVKYNADEWVQLARDAGMKYLVITAKHHDGFAMYDSDASDFNMVDATPYGKDPMKPLSEACARHGIKFGFYYSQAQDWHEPNAAGNNWDFPAERDPAPYIRKKLLPQVDELLENYGDLALIWFDTPQLLNKDQVIALRRSVKEKQPGCLVNSRIGHGQGDYDQTGDNSIPTQASTANVWEVPATLNDTWGYKKNDHDWKNPRDLVCKLADIVSKGGNYLLNIGPDAEGNVPPESQRILRAIGGWLAVNGESIYETRHSPFNVNGITWRCTAKPGKLYLHLLSWPGESFELDGLVSRVKAARFLDGGKAVPFSQAGHRLSLKLPPVAPDRYNTVVVLEIADEQAEVLPEYRYDTDPAVRHLFAWEARMRGEEFRYDWETQSASNFIDGTRPRNELRWLNYPKEEGEYQVDIEYACDDAKAGSPFVLSSHRDQWMKESTDVSELHGVIEGTGGQFVTRRLGNLKIFSPECTIIFGLRDDFRSASVRVRKLVLTKIEPPAG
jgi:alpha-L-fucosidase